MVALIEAIEHEYAASATAVTEMIVAGANPDKERFGLDRTEER